MCIRLFVLLFCVNFCVCANILMMDGMPSPSHQIFVYGIVEGLLEKGYNVTILGPASVRKIQNKNLHHLDLEGLYKALYTEFDSEVVSSFGVLDMMQLFYDYSISACNHSLQTPGFKALLNYPQDFKFDAIIIDLTIGECFLPLIQRFRYPPAVALTALQLPPFLANDFGNNLQLAHKPSFYSTFSDDMTFFERLENYIVTYTDIYFRKNYMVGEMTKMLVKEFGQEMEPLHKLLGHMSLLLANYNPVLNYPEALTPNIIPIGGAHIKVKKLPKDIQEIMDNSPNGVVLFSLGTNVRADKLSKEKIVMFVNTLNKVKATVLWKFESNITGLASNVIVRKWLPQTDLLAHPNLKLFISHCGGLSTVEISHFGVPVLGIPFFIDQRLNIDRMVALGGGRKLDYFTLTEGVFLENINEMLYNEKYSKNMKELSSRIRDQPQTPLERAMFWIEYSIRHNGTHFLNAKTRTLPWFISSSTDIHLFILGIICISLFILSVCCKFVKSLLVNNAKTDNKRKID